MLLNYDVKNYEQNLINNEYFSFIYYLLYIILAYWLRMDFRFYIVLLLPI